jgi:hypothetical protein
VKKKTSVAKVLPADPVAAPDSIFDAVLEKLAGLSMNHLLFFRVEAGRTVAFEFFGNNRALYESHAPNKATSFRRFCRERAAQLADLGLTEDLLRKSIRAWWVVEDLPHAVSQHLRFSHVVVLAQVDDPATRRLLAQATLDNRWTGETLKDAVLAAQTGHWIDDEPDEPGLQPGHHEPAGPPPLAPGRVVTRFEKSIASFADLATRWDRVPVERLTASQTRRMEGSIVKMEEHIAHVKQRLALARKRGNQTVVK